MKEIRKKFPMLKDKDDEEDEVLLDELIHKDKLVKSDEMNSVVFVSDDVRHMVMIYFVRKCLKTENDYECYINLSSVDSLVEYARPWWYDPDGDERCMFLPECMEELFIERLGIDVIRHVMVEDRKDSEECDRAKETRTTVSKICKCTVIEKKLHDKELHCL
jgi:hypothetical protein